MKKRCCIKPTIAQVVQLVDLTANSIRSSRETGGGKVIRYAIQLSVRHVAI